MNSKMGLVPVSELLHYPFLAQLSIFCFNLQLQFFWIFELNLSDTMKFHNFKNLLILNHFCNLKINLSNFKYLYLFTFFFFFYQVFSEKFNFSHFAFLNLLSENFLIFFFNFQFSIQGFKFYLNFLIIFKIYPWKITIHLRSIKY